MRADAPARPARSERRRLPQPALVAGRVVVGLRTLCVDVRRVDQRQLAKGTPAHEAHPVRQLPHRAVQRLARGRRLRQGDATPASILALALADRYHYIRHVYRPGLTDCRAARQPGHRDPALPVPGHARSGAGRGSVGVRMRPRLRPTSGRLPPSSVHSPPSAARLDRRDRQPFEGFEPAGGARPCGDCSTPPAGCSRPTATTRPTIDQIVTEAGVARGTFYRYFSDKLELITALAYEAADDDVPAVRRVRRVRPHAPSRRPCVIGCGASWRCSNAMPA